MRKQGLMTFAAMAALAVVGTFAGASRQGHMQMQPQAAVEGVATAEAAAGFDDALSARWQHDLPSVGDGSAGN